MYNGYLYLWNIFMELPAPQAKSFSSILAGIEDGRIQIPQFQRDFVWSMQKSAYIIDSILKGYPIGTFIFWRTTERLRTVRSVGGLKFKDAGKYEPLDFVLDGQQRLTSLYACFKGAKIIRDNNHEENFNNVVVDLRADEKEQVVIIKKDNVDKNYCVSVKDLFKGSMNVLYQFPEEYHEKINEYRNRIMAYQYSVIQLNNASIDTATEVFTRINIGGKSLTLFEIMVAKTFDDELSFDLAEKYQALINQLENIDYETISDKIVLQTIALIIGKECKGENILKLDKKIFINTWPKAVDALERAAEYFRLTYRIPVSKILPYNSLITIFAYFFNKHPDKPSTEQEKLLKEFFWRISLSGRYSSAVETKLAQDVKHIDNILNNKNIDYKTPEWSVDLSPEYIEQNGWFATGRAYIKAILCIYAYYEPKSFKDNAQVRLDNSWLKQANSKNYHHFFPKAYMRKQGIDDNISNNILNITMVDDYLNKRDIGSKKPSIYMKEFKEGNKNIMETMKTHLINDIDNFGIPKDDYNTFIKKRAEIVSQKLKERINNLPIDGNLKINEDDYEEE